MFKTSVKIMENEAKTLILKPGIDPLEHIFICYIYSNISFIHNPVLIYIVCVLFLHYTYDTYLKQFVCIELLMDFLSHWISQL